AWLSNMYVMTVTAEGGLAGEKAVTARGLVVAGDEGILDNSWGSITVTAAGDESDATGMMAAGDANELRNNGGSIIVTATGDRTVANGFMAAGDDNNLTNVGVLSVTAEGGEAENGLG